MRKVLVTGGAGFIGSHLCDALLKRGDEVFVLDDLSTGRLDNLAQLQGHDRLHITIGSILDLARLEPLVRNADIVFHLAAVVGVKKIIDSPVETIETNVLGSHNVLSLAARFRKLSFVASTSEVYGKSAKHPFSEDDDVVYGPTTKSRWGYACSKAIDEFLALAYHESHGLPVIVARFFNTTGPRQTGRYGMVLPRFVNQALRGEPITVFGTGLQRRCFADVRDVVRGAISLTDDPRSVGNVFNIGNPEEVSIYQLAVMVKEITDSDSEIRLIPYDQAYQPGFEDMDRRVPNISKIAQLTGFKPKYRLREIVNQVIAGCCAELETVSGVPATAVLQPHSLLAGAGD
jgi:UDP-glucose 4-epimerase